MSRQYLHEVEKIVLRMMKLFAESHQNDFDLLSNRIAALANSPWTKAHVATGELTNTVFMLRAERQRQGLKLHEIQAATGINRSALSDIETQKNLNPSIATLNRIAAALGKKLVVALVDADEQESQNEEADTKSATMNQELPA